MKIGSIVINRTGWYWQYAEGTHMYSQYKNGQSRLRNPIRILQSLIFWVLAAPFIVIAAGLMYLGGFSDSAENIWQGLLIGF